MGQLESVAFEDGSATPPNVLGGDLSLRGVANAIKDGSIRKVCVLTGAGISVSSGIPDFRSQGSGIYYNLKEYDLPNPEAMFELEYFKNHPTTFYTFLKKLLPGEYKPTYTHYFIRLLEVKGILLRCYSQNIDGLEKKAGCSDRCIVEAHGTFSSASCVECGTKYPLEALQKDIKENRIPHCSCGELVKPDIVFYGEPLPLPYLWMHNADMIACDFLLVMGTSLCVQPFSGLVHKVREDVPRMCINKEAVGPFRFCDMACCFRDIMVEGDCDEKVKELCDLLGWREELEKLYNAGVAEPILFPVEEK